MPEYKQKFGDKLWGFFFNTKLRFAITFICWSFIYKIIDMNTLQWFGKDIFIDGGIFGFCVASVFAFCLVILPIGIIYEFFNQ